MPPTRTHPGPTRLLLAPALAALTACTPIQPAPAPASPLATPAPPATTKAISETATVEGTLAFAGTGAPPTGAVAEVLLVGDQFETLGSASITLGDEVGPVPFHLAYDPAALDPNGIYALLARVLVDGQTTWATLEPAVVITQGFPTSGVTLTLTPADGQ